jgi:hypothetical protein
MKRSQSGPDSLSPSPVIENLAAPLSVDVFRTLDPFYMSSPRQKTQHRALWNLNYLREFDECVEREGRFVIRRKKRDGSAVDIRPEHSQSDSDHIGRTDFNEQVNPWNLLFQRTAMRSLTIFLRIQAFPE